MTSLKRIFSKRPKTPVNEDISNTDPELGHPLTTDALSRTPSTPNRHPNAQVQRQSAWAQNFIAAMNQQHPKFPLQTCNHSHSSMSPSPNYQLPSTKYQPPSLNPGFANVDTTCGTEDEPRKSTISPDPRSSQADRTMSPGRYEDAFQAMQSLSPETSASPTRDRADYDLRRGTPFTGGTETASDGIFEDMVAYEQDDLLSQGDHQIASEPDTPSVATFVPNPDSTDLSQFAWTPNHSDDEWEEPSSLISRRLDLKSDDLSRIDDVPNTPEATSRSQDPVHSLASLADPPSSNPLPSSDPLPLSNTIPSSGYTSRDISVPYLDVAIPAGDLNLRTSTSLPSSSVIRYSAGLITNGTSQRALSEAEIGKTIQSLGEMVRSGLNPSHKGIDGRRSSLSDLMESELSGQPRARLPEINALRSAESGPGSSQTSSSLSADRSIENAIGRRGRTDSNDVSRSSSSRMRSPTPPMLYGRRTIVATRSSDRPSRPVLDRANSRLGKAMKEIGVSGRSRLAQAYPLGSGDKDWVTVSDMKETGTQSGGDIDSEGQTGSSLADNSDSGNLSTTRQLQTRLGSINARRLAQQSALQRPHQAFVFIKDAETGRTISVAQQGTASGSHAAAYAPNPHMQNHDYQHPSPLSLRHVNPFKSSPPVIKGPQKSSSISTEAESFAIQKSENQGPDETAITDDFDQLVHRYGSKDDSPVGEESSYSLGEMSQSSSQSLNGTNPPESTAWLSTVADTDARLQSSLPDRKGSFAKVTVLGQKGNLTGTPDGTGAREVGSSLAGVSSPPQASSPPDQPSVSETRLDSPSRLRSRRLNPFASPQGSPSINSKFTTPKFETSSKANRRRSSSESDYREKSTMSAVKTSARKSPNPCSHRKANSMAGLLSSGVHLPLNEVVSGIMQSPPEVRERRNRDSHVTSDQISMSTRSRTTVLRNTAHGITASPASSGPIRSDRRTWDRLKRNRGRLQAPIYACQRPIAREESEHLYWLPRIPTLELLKTQQQLSKFWLIIFCIIPPAAIIFGHGFADQLIELQTDGEIVSFTRQSKAIALCWGYSVSSVSIIVCIFIGLDIGGVFG